MVGVGFVLSTLLVFGCYITPAMAYDNLHALVLPTDVSLRFSGGGQDGRQITVAINTAVNVYVTLSSSSSVSGTVKVEVCRDVYDWPNEVKTTLTKSAAISGSELLMGSFVADNYGGSFKSYFIRVYWNDQKIYDPSDPNTREWVKTTYYLLPLRR